MAINEVAYLRVGLGMIPDDTKREMLEKREDTTTQWRLPPKGDRGTDSLTEDQRRSIGLQEHLAPRRAQTAPHLGFGEFSYQGDDGEVEFDRMRGKDFPGQSGRSHKLYDNKKGKLVAKLIKAMETKRKSELVSESLDEGIPGGGSPTKTFVFSSREKAGDFAKALAKRTRLVGKPSVKKTKGWNTFSVVAKFNSFADTMDTGYKPEKPHYKDIIRDLKEGPEPLDEWEWAPNPSSLARNPLYIRFAQVMEELEQHLEYDADFTHLVDELEALESHIEGDSVEFSSIEEKAFVRQKIGGAKKAAELAGLKWRRQNPADARRKNMQSKRWHARHKSQDKRMAKTARKGYRRADVDALEANLNEHTGRMQRVDDSHLDMGVQRRLMGLDESAPRTFNSTGIMEVRRPQQVEDRGEDLMLESFRHLMGWKR